MSALAMPLLLAVGALFMLLERGIPAHPAMADRGWHARAGIINVAQIVVFFLVADAWTRWGTHRSLDVAGPDFPPIAGAFAAYVVFTFVIYWWHRLRHASPFIWRVFHQLHHSPTRIEALTAYYVHPLDMAVDLTIGYLILFPLLGLGLEAAGWYTLITGAAGFFIHANIRVPRWVGYVFQTPEMHRLHHKSGHHAHNYSDIVCWDLLFGTYANPEQPVERCGFDAATERRIGSMLLGKDLTPAIDAASRDESTEGAMQ